MSLRVEQKSLAHSLEHTLKFKIIIKKLISLNKNEVPKDERKNQAKFFSYPKKHTILGRDRA